MKIQPTEFTKKEVNELIKGDYLAKEMMLFADKNESAVSKSEFQAKLDKVSKLSSRDLIRFIRAFEKDESVIELICDEIGNGKASRKDACEKIFGALIAVAEKYKGIDIEYYKDQFKTEIDSQFRFMGKYIKTDKLDSIINSLTQAIEDRLMLDESDLEKINSTS